MRELVSEVVGMSPYERRMLDMLKTGGTGAEKRMYKFAKRRVSDNYRMFILSLFLFLIVVEFFCSLLSNRPSIVGFSSPCVEEA